MVDDPADSTRRFINVFAIIAFIAIFVFLVWISFLDTKASLNQGSALASGLLGAFINPPKKDGGNLRAAWVALVVLTAFATGACAVGFFNASHGAAGSAVAAADGRLRRAAHRHGKVGGATERAGGIGRDPNR